MLAINEILQERYRIIRQLGQGGMGAIYVAEDIKRFGKLVALKEILIDLAKLPDQKQRDLFRRAFEREAKILTQLEHEAFPQVVDYFLETNRQFLVMELVQGEDLGELLEKDQKPFPLEDVLKWTEQLLDALDYLHTLSPPVIHRDIKPQNLKVTARGKIKLLDFGIATGSNAQVQATITNYTFIAATLHYSPLEQIVKVIDPGYRKLLQQKFGERLTEIIDSRSDASSDIYALGATLYHLLTARLPVDALKRTLEIWDESPDPLQSPLKVNPQIPREISRWLLKAMAIEREDRFASAAEMQRALREAIFLEEEARRSEEQEKLKRERELIAQERQQFEAERLSHWRQIEEEQKRQAEIAAQKQIDGQKEWKAQKTEIGETQPSFPLPAVTQPSPEVYKPSTSKETEFEIPVNEIKSKADSSNLTEASYLPKNFHANKKQETIHEHEIIRGIPPVSQETKKKPVWILPTSLLGLLLFVGAVLGFWLLSGKSENAKPVSVTNSNSVTDTNTNTTATTTPKAPENMAYVPGGEFLMGWNGSKLDEEKPAHKVSVNPFYMDTTEVTNEQYAEFVKSINYKQPTEWKGGLYPNGQAKFPVVGVNWEDANTFCKNAVKRLPTEEEWEFAARGTSNFLYPWGNEWKPGQANLGSRTFSEVGRFPGVSPFGIYDLVGNAGEWTASDFKAYPGGKLSDYFTGKTNLKTVRGGSIDTLIDAGVATYRIGLQATGAETYNRTGFRCVKDIER